MHFNQVFDDSALNSFNHFSYELNETEVEFVMEFLLLLMLLFWRHHKDKVHSSNRLCRYDSLYPKFFLIVHRKY